MTVAVGFDQVSGLISKAPALGKQIGRVEINRILEMKEVVDRQAAARAVHAFVRHIALEARDAQDVAPGTKDPLAVITGQLADDARMKALSEQLAFQMQNPPEAQLVGAVVTAQLVDVFRGNEGHFGQLQVDLLHLGRQALSLSRQRFDLLLAPEDSVDDPGPLFSILDGCVLYDFPEAVVIALWVIFVVVGVSCLLVLFVIAIKLEQLAQVGKGRSRVLSLAILFGDAKVVVVPKTAGKKLELKMSFLKTERKSILYLT